MNFKEHKGRRERGRMLQEGQGTKGNPQETRQLTEQKQTELCRARLKVGRVCRAMVFKLGPQGPWGRVEKMGGFTPLQTAPLHLLYI